MALPAHHIKKHIASQYTKCMQCITPHMPFTYVKMVLRQHAIIKLHHPLLQSNRIDIPSQNAVNRSQIFVGLACTSYSKTIASQYKKRMQCITPQMPLTYVRMVLRQHAMIKFQQPFLHHKRIRMLSKFEVDRSHVFYGKACTSYSKKQHFSTHKAHAAHNSTRPSPMSG
jgi:hypothetical protein